MEAQDPRIRSLLRQARQVAESNKRSAAEQLYRQIIAEAAGTVEAWLGLAALLTNKAEQEQAVVKALALQPENEQALKWMERLQMGLPMQEEQPAAMITPEVELEQVAPLALASSPEIVAEDAGSLKPITVGEGSVPAQTVACANHPNRQTNLRCNKCNKPICIRCAQWTPVGYSCRSCIRQQEEKFFNAEPVHIFIGILVAIPLALLAAAIATLIGFWFFAIFIGATFGTLISRAVLWAMGKRRSRYMPLIVAGIIILTAILVLIFTFDFLSLGVYVALSASSAYYWLK